MGSAVLQLSEHNWEVKVPDEYKPENTVTFNGKKYNLLQFHFHTPAEHAIGEKDDLKFYFLIYIFLMGDKL